MATVYNVMLYGGLALAIVFAIVAVVLFFVLKIPKAVGIATGSTARKKIDEIKEKGYESVQGGGASKQEAIKNHTSRISVRDVKSILTSMAAALRRRQTSSEKMRMRKQRMYSEMTRQTRKQRTYSEAMTQTRKQRTYSEVMRQTRKQRTYSEAMTQTRKQRTYLEAMTQMIPQPFFREDAQRAR